MKNPSKYQYKIGNWDLNVSYWTTTFYNNTIDG